MNIVFTKHALDKFSLLKRHNFEISPNFVKSTIATPDLIDHSRKPLIIAQKQIDQTHVLRVVYKIELGLIKVITFYPGRNKQYEK